MKPKDMQLLEGIRAGEPLVEFYRQGGTPEDARIGTEKIIGPYFQHRARLQDIPIDLLFPCARGIATIISQGVEPKLDEFLKIYRIAHRRDPAESLRLLVEEQQSIEDALAIFWSLFHLQRDCAPLELEEFLHETLRNVGAILEGLVKPMMLALSRQARLAAGGSAAGTSDNLSFGHALELLERTVADASVLEIRGVRVNQWRNIAQHFSATIEGEDIVCRYGAQTQHLVRLQREQLDSVLVSSMLLFRTLSTAREIFFFDHMHDMHDAGLLPISGPLKQRPEAAFTVLLGGIASQGFTIIHTALTLEWSVLVVQDVSTMPAESRRLHASQFVVPLAKFRPAAMLSVEYRERDGTPSLLVIVPLELIERAKTADDLSLVANEATFIDLKKLSPDEIAQMRPPTE